MKRMAQCHCHEPAFGTIIHHDATHLFQNNIRIGESQCFSALGFFAYLIFRVFRAFFLFRPQKYR